MNQLRILVVDDDINLLELYTAILGTNEIYNENNKKDDDEFNKINSYDVVTVEQGDEAIEKVRESIDENNPFSIVFLDLHMPPGPDGVTTAENIRKLDPYIEIVIVTGYSAIPPREISRRVKPLHKLLYIQKPFSAVELIQFASSLGSKWCTDRKLRKINENLENLVKERTSELEETNKLLKQEIEEHKKAREALLLDESRLEALLKLSQMTDNSLEELVDFALEKGINLTKSKTGYIGLIDEKENTIIINTCDKNNNPMVYNLDIEGLWTEVLKEKKPVIRLECHVPEFYKSTGKILRHMDIPVFDGNSIVAITGVSNKEDIYDEADIRQLTLLMDGMWKIIHKKQAEEALRKTKEEFVTILSHDLKSPLASMMSLVELIADPGFGEISNNKLEYIQLLRSSGDVLLTLINNIVMSSRLEYNLIEYSFEDFSLNKFLESTCDIFEPLALQGKIALSYTCPEDTFVNGDYLRIQQVFYNLISNALRYTPPGGSITITATTEKEKVNIEISDTGKGIMETEQDKLFDKYVQGKGERRGSGLGLYIVKSFLDAHNSNIHLKSSPGEGASFFFSLKKVMRNA